MTENKLKSLLSVYLSEETAEKLASSITEDTPILIDGTKVPTGKTTLCRELNALGYNAVEVWNARKKESDSNTNSFSVTITLNKRVDMEHFFRRFIVRTKENLPKALEIIQQKGLSRDDIAFLLDTFYLNHLDYFED